MAIINANTEKYSKIKDVIFNWN